MRKLFFAAWLGIWTGLGPAAAPASVVRRMSPDQLAQGADVVVEGRVARVESMWNQARTGLETHVRVAVRRVVEGRAAPVIDIVQPGGELDGNRHVIVGMPVFTQGEDVRLYLEERGPVYRVYGWAQGKWVARTIHTDGQPGASGGGDGALIYAPDPEPAPAARDGVIYYTHNGMVWPPSKIPVPYLIHRDGTPDVPLADAQAAVHAAFATWQAVPCSSLSFTYAGETDLGMAVDGQNVITWIEAGWIYGDEAAAATSLWIPVEEERTADIAMNGQGFSWAIEPAAAVSFSTLDIQAVLTHELGHFSGLSHTRSSLDTMYISWRPWPGQRTLSADDKLGLCALYPQPGNECEEPADCAEPGSQCISYELGTLCTPLADSMGAACSYERIECEHFCLFMAADLSSGYCSRFCEEAADCPAGFVCAAASAGGTEVKVCFMQAASEPDAGPLPDVCAAHDDCPPGRYCGPDQRCAYDCLEPIDCPADQQCNEHGQCVTLAGKGGGCGCSAGSAGQAGIIALALMLIMGSWQRRKRLTPPRASISSPSERSSSEITR